jgi:hypothetical protein
MPTDAADLLSHAADVLRRQQVAFALIGASALAIHGVSRSTLDVDLLVVDGRVLAGPFWSTLDPAVDRDIRTGDAEDPLAGVVRLRAAGDRDVDIVVGRSQWQSDAIARAGAVEYAGLTLPVVDAADLVLMKLYAGGSQDRWDIDQLLAGDDRAGLVSEVETRLVHLPTEARRLWTHWRKGPES